MFSTFTSLHAFFALHLGPVSFQKLHLGPFLTFLHAFILISLHLHYFAHICIVLRVRILFCLHLHCVACPHPALLSFTSFCAPTLVFLRFYTVLCAWFCFSHRFTYLLLFSFACHPRCLFSPLFCFIACICI